MREPLHRDVGVPLRVVPGDELASQRLLLLAIPWISDQVDALFWVLHLVVELVRCPLVVDVLVLVRANHKGGDRRP